MVRKQYSEGDLRNWDDQDERDFPKGNILTAKPVSSLMYERHAQLERRYTSRKNLATKHNRVLIPQFRMLGHFARKIVGTAEDRLARECHHAFEIVDRRQ